MVKTERTTSARSKAIILLLLAVSCAVAFWMHFAAANATANAQLVVPESALDFGEVWEEEGFQWKLPIRNPTGRAVEISSFQSAPLCTSIQPGSLVIPPGDAAEVTLTLDLSRICIGQEKLPVRDFSVPIVPVIQGSLPGQRGWVIRGRVRVPLLLEPYEVDFGDNLVQGQPFSSRRVSVTSTTPLARVIARSDSARVSAKLTPVGDGNSRELEIVPEGSLGPGPWQANVLLEMLTATGEAIPPKRLRVRGVVKEDIEAVPSVVLLGACPVGGTAQETVVLRSTSGKPFEVRAVKTTSQHLVAEREGQTAPNLKQYRISQRVTWGDPQNGSITFRVEAERGEALLVTVPVLCLAIPSENEGPR